MKRMELKQRDGRDDYHLGAIWDVFYVGKKVGKIEVVSALFKNVKGEQFEGTTFKYSSDDCKYIKTHRWIGHLHNHLRGYYDRMLVKKRAESNG